ncbi:MAG: hypothetical protein IKN82_04725 [Treponema sp.]|jgi:hypothetical protein|nr:hypothetical protein [Treponema sp.]
MKNIKKIALAVFVGTLFSAFFSAMCVSCYKPSPLYGAWADNAGNKISFADDGSFSATIRDTNGDSKNYSGNYAVIENIISFSKDDGSINSEWDIRGGILYLTWFDSYGEAISLVLYHSA